MNRELIERHVQAAAEKISEVEEKMADPSIVSDRNQMSELGREHHRLKEILAASAELKDLEEQLEEAQEMAADDSDEEMAELAKAEVDTLTPKAETAINTLHIALIPPDNSDNKTAIVEVRAGTGGEEAGLFAGDLYRMYLRYAERANWKTETLSGNSSEMGGFKEIVFAVRGDGAYGLLKYESGVHRVQRVPSTESQGRIHTSAVSVAVLPEANEVDVDVDENELRIDTYRASGAGGQHVNKTESAIRITHIPTGLVVTCQDEKSQHKNKAKAMRVLRSRLYEQALQAEADKRAESRRSLVGTGDRSAKIRTYNFPQGRVTDHRINLTLYRLNEILDGDLNETIDALRLHDAEERLREGVSSNA